MNDKRQTVMRALFQVYGNVTLDERQRLEHANRECWRAQANGGQGWQRDADNAFRAELTQIIEEMPEYRVKLIADYIAP